VEVRPGTLTILMDGRWDIEDLSSFADGLEEVYGYFCSVLIEDKELRRRVNDLVQREFWSGVFERSRVGERVYGMLPDAAGLKVKSIRYASPGAVELLGVLGVLLLMAKVVKSWTEAGSGLLDLYQKAEKFFADHPIFRKPGRNFNLTAVAGRDIDDARALMFDLGGMIGLDKAMCERVLDMSGNPISGLRFVVALALQARKISVLQDRGLLKLAQGAVTEAEPEKAREDDAAQPRPDPPSRL
jgi:hypothetical protein